MCPLSPNRVNPASLISAGKAFCSSTAEFFTLFFILLPLLFLNPGAVSADESAVLTWPGPKFDLVILNGRVIDPESGLDRSGLNIGISRGKISTITGKPLSGKRVIDASGLVVCPGFIDPLSYNPDPVGVWYKLADGVTTNLSLHGGTTSPDSYFRALEKEKQPLNYGVSYFVAARRVALGVNNYLPASPEQIKAMVRDAEKAVLAGAMGVSFSLEYYPGTGPEEVIPLLELANRYNVPAFFHLRYSTMYGGGGTNIDAIKEVLSYAEKTGSAVHIDHINSTGGTFSMTESLKLLTAARSEGMIITACTYPYNYWATRLSSARFDEGWQERFQISYHDLQLIGQRERLDREEFKKYRSIYGKLAVAYAIPSADVEKALKADFVMIGSDGMIEKDPAGGPPGMNNHPRGAGCFSRVIAEYVRGNATISLMEALRKMTILPAKLVEKQVPAMRFKGRLQEGMDADIVIFDYQNIKDRADVLNPAQYSAGIKYVLVNGQVVIDENGIHRNIRAGRPLRAEFDYLQPSGRTRLTGLGAVPVYHFQDQTYLDAAWLEKLGLSFRKEGFRERRLVLLPPETAVENGQSSRKPGQLSSVLPPPETNLQPLLARREISWLILPDGDKIEVFKRADHYYLPLQAVEGYLP